MTSRTLRSPILLADFIGNFSASLQLEHGNFIEVLNFEVILGRSGAANSTPQKPTQSLLQLSEFASKSL
jgi:hypothetical protein